MHIGHALMGARLVARAFTAWAQLGGQGFQLLTFMALTCPDRAEAPRVELSRESMAKALGYDALTAAAISAVTRAVRSLLKAGALEVAQDAAPGQRRHFWIKFERPASIERSADLPTVGQVDGRRNKGATVGKSADRPSMPLPQEKNKDLKDSAPRRGAPHQLTPIRGGSKMTSKRPSMPGQKPITGMSSAIADATWQPAQPAPENAGHITRKWIDYCAGQGVTLPRRIIGQYAKGIGEAIADGFSPNLVKTALAGMLADGIADRPSLLANRLVRAQAGPERRRPALTEVNGRMLNDHSLELMRLMERAAAQDAAEAAGQQWAVGS